MIKKRWAFYALLLGFGLGANIDLFKATYTSAQQYLAERKMYQELENENIVVSFTTTPHRINDLKHVLDQLSAQNAPIKQIYISVPYIFKRDNIEYVIPDWLKTYPKVTILRTEDYGPGTKLLGVLAKGNLPPESIVITVDDDINYPKNLILQLAYKAKQYPDRAIGISGVNVYYNYDGNIIASWGNGLTQLYKPDAQVAILEGFGGVAYRPKFFDKDIFELANAPRDCYNSDDLYISFYLAKHNVPRQVLMNDYIDREDIAWNEPIGMNNDALHKLGPPIDKHVSCIKYMKQNDPEVKF